MYAGKRVAVLSNGCRRRGADAARLQRYFEANGLTLVQRYDQADLLVLITCAYNQHHEDECFALIRRLRRLNGKLIVLGCLPGIAADRLRREFGGTSLATKELDRIDELFPTFKTRFAKIPDINHPLDRLVIRQKNGPGRLLRRLAGLFVFDNLSADFTLEPDVAGDIGVLRISNGCPGQCTYCAIHNATGPLRSKPVETCVAEYRQLMEAGYRIIEFTGEDTGAYGIDLGTSLGGLLTRLAAVPTNCEIEWCLTAVNPVWAVRECEALTGLIRQGRIKRLVCPIQTGSRRMLKAMQRYADTDKIKAALTEFRQASHTLQLDTHVLFGFPGETEEDFGDTLQVLRDIRFDDVMWFPYSDRDGTPAAEINLKIDHATMNDRKERLITLLRELRSS